MSWFGDLVGDLVDFGEVIGGNSSAAVPPAVQAENVVSSGGVLAGIWGDLTNYKMWRSLGWLLLGVALIIAGLFLLVKNELLPPVLRSGL